MLGVNKRPRAIGGVGNGNGGPVIEAIAGERASGTSERLRSEQPSLLVGLVFDAEGRAMTPSHATKPGKRYRYYVTRPDQLDNTPAWRVAAYDLENIICDQLSALLSGQHFICEMAPDAPTEGISQALANADLAAAALRSGTARNKALLLAQLVHRIDLQEEGVDLTIDQTGLNTLLGLEVADQPSLETLMFTLPATKVRRGHQLRRIMVSRIAEALAARKLILTNPEQPIASIAASHSRCRTRLGKLAALACLAPDIVTAIVEGRQPAALTARTLHDIDLWLAWADQRALLGFA